MINKESGIIYLFAKEPWKKFTFTEIKKDSKKKSKSYLELVLKNLLSENILKKENKGNLKLYSLNIASQKARAYSGFILEHQSWNKNHIPYSLMQKTMDKIPTPNFIFLITGSYASNKQKKTSDIDVVILIDDSLNPNTVYAELQHFCELAIPSIHLHVFRDKGFIDMLVSKKPNYGKEISENFLVLSGGQIYLKLIEEAISNGFKNA